MAPKFCPDGLAVGTGDGWAVPFRRCGAHIAGVPTAIPARRPPFDRRHLLCRRPVAVPTAILGSPTGSYPDGVWPTATVGIAVRRRPGYLCRRPPAVGDRKSVV